MEDTNTGEAVLAEKQPDRIPPVMDPKLAAEYLLISRTMLDKLTANGDIRVARMGRIVRYRREWLDEFLDRASSQENSKDRADSIVKSALSKQSGTKKTSPDRGSSSAGALGRSLNTSQV